MTSAFASAPTFAADPWMGRAAAVVGSNGDGSGFQILFWTTTSGLVSPLLIVGARGAVSRPVPVLEPCTTSIFQVAKLGMRGERSRTMLSSLLRLVDIPDSAHDAAFHQKKRRRWRKTEGGFNT